MLIIIFNYQDLNIGESESKLLCEELQHNYSLQELNLEGKEIFFFKLNFLKLL